MGRRSDRPAGYPGPEPGRAGAGDFPRPRRRDFWYAWSGWTFSVAATATALTYDRLHPLPTSLINFQGGTASGVLAVAFIGSFATMGALLAWKRPGNPIGWLLSAIGMCYAFGAVGLLLAHFPQTLTLANWLSWMWLFGLGLTVFVLLLFPTGTLPSRRWRPVAWVAAAGLAGWVLGNAFAPTILSADPAGMPNPIGMAGPAGAVFQVMASGGSVLTLACGLAAIVSLLARYRRAQLVEREQLKWLVYASALIVVALLAEVAIGQIMGATALSNNIQNATSSGAVALVPIAVGIAVLRYHLYDIEVVINKTLVYGSLAAFITSVYVAIVVGIGSFAAQHSAQPSLVLSIVATAVVAVAFQPVRERVQHLANRLVYGKRATPYEVLAEFAGRMAGTYATEDLLPRMARILAEGTAAVRADVWLASGSEFRDGASWPRDAPPLPIMSAPAAAGQLASPGTDTILPVQHQGEVLGALSVTKRPGEALTPTEARLLSDLAGQVGLVLRNVGLWEQLSARLAEIQASRQRLVAAQDAERRRIERNIHDGAQQQLVALAIKLSLTESMIGDDSAGEREMLAELREEASTAVEELRDLARGIYPPLLVGEGLIPALRAQAARSPVPAVLDADGIGRYPQDVEAAVYFCVLEALQNVAKYSGADGVLVRLGIDGDDLEFEVSDDGVGFDLGARAFGSGLQGIADRVGTRGGTLKVSTAPGEGTVIRGRLPAVPVETAA